MTTENEADPQTTQPITVQKPDLIIGLLGQMTRDRQFTTNALLDSYKTQTEKASATLDVVRMLITDLLDSDYMPTPAALKRALYPSPELVKHYMDNEGEDRYYDAPE